LPRPVVSQEAEDLYAALGPWSKADTDNAFWYLLDLCEAVAGRLTPIEAVIRDDPNTDDPGWSIVMDVDRAPPEWLGWLAQFGGVRLDPALDDAAQRARIKSTDGFKRGTPSAIVAAAQQYLTGTKSVFLSERSGSAYRFTISTLIAETPNLADVIAALIKQKPAGLVMSVMSITGADYDSVAGTHTDYNDVRTTFVNWAEMLSNPVKQ
jgi:hypothetical protein